MNSQFFCTIACICYTTVNSFGSINDSLPKEERISLKTGLIAQEVYQADLPFFTSKLVVTSFAPSIFIKNRSQNIHTFTITPFSVNGADIIDKTDKGHISQFTIGIKYDYKQFFFKEKAFPVYLNIGLQSIFSHTNNFPLTSIDKRFDNNTLTSNLLIGPGFKKDLSNRVFLDAELSFPLITNNRSSSFSNTRFASGEMLLIGAGIGVKL